MKKHLVIDARESGTTTGRYVDKLVEYLHQLKPGFQITLVTRPARVEYLQSIAPRFTVVSTLIKEFTFAEQIAYIKVLKKLKPDLVHFTAAQQPVLYLDPVISSMHDLTTGRFRNPAKNWLVFTIKQNVYRQVVRWVARKSKHILTISEYSKDDIAKFARVNSRKITVTYPAADEINEPDEPVETLIHKDFIMYVGRPLPHKNLDRLVEAFVLLQKKNPELRLVLAGKKDTLYKKLEKKVTDQGIENVVFTDFVSEAELKWLYLNTRAYVFPSLSEGFGLPSIEAMLHGAPVVSSNASCLPEVNKEAARYFDPYSPEDMADKIQEVLSNKRLRSSMIKKGKRVAKSYSWKRMAQETLAIYKDFI